MQLLLTKKVTNLFILEALSGAGGIGKSTLCACLASYFAHAKGMRVAVLDMDESKQLTDAYTDKETPWQFVSARPVNGAYDILIVDNAPDTKTPTNNPDLLLYPLLPHAKSLNALERTKQVIKGDAVFITSKCDARKGTHRQYKKFYQHQLNALTIHDWTVYEHVMEFGYDFMQIPKNNAFYKAKNEIALIAQRIEEYIK